MAMASKSELRKAMRLQAKRQPPSVADSLPVWARVEALPEFAAASHVLIFASLPDELPTAEFIAKHRASKHFYLPRVVGDALLIAPMSGDLAEGAFGILEPTGDAVALDTIELAIVPGVAFTPDCKRLGRGGGYYDRLLSEARCLTVAVALDRQVLDDIPSEPHDVNMDIVVTQSNVYRKNPSL